jgi:hypothetical protein
MAMRSAAQAVHGFIFAIILGRGAIQRQDIGADTMSTRRQIALPRADF